MYTVIRLCAAMFALLFSTLLNAGSATGNSGGGDSGGQGGGQGDSGSGSQGGSQGDGQGGNAGQSSGQPDQGGQGGTSTVSMDFHTNELRRVGAKEAREKETSILNKAKEKAGAESLDDLYKLAEEGRKAREASQTAEERQQEQQRQQVQAETNLKAERDAERTRANNAEIDRVLTLDLVAAGANPERIRKILHDPDLAKPEYGEDGKLEATTSYVTNAKKEWPELFGTQEQRRRIPPGPPANGGGGGGNQDPVEDYFKKNYGERTTTK